MPLHWTADGLPLGAHFIAPPGGEPMLLRLAAQLEQAAPWGDREPRRLDGIIHDRRTECRTTSTAPQATPTS